MDLLILQGFNNYFNRIIKKYSKTADYISKSANSKVFPNINFNPNDGVRTKQIIGVGAEDTFNYGSCDYLVAFNQEQVTSNSEGYCEANEYEVGQWEALYDIDVKLDSVDEIIDMGYEVLEGEVNLPGIRKFRSMNTTYIEFYSQAHSEQEAEEIKVKVWWKHIEDKDITRWFIVEAKRTRGNQYELTLKRDTIADNFDTLINCPAYIKKGVLSDTNPLILNSEGVSVNQKKSGETLLKDKTGSAWIVGYMAKNAPSTSISTQIPTDSTFYYETIESIAASLGVSSTALAAVLTTAKNNQTYFVNDNIEFLFWNNFHDNTDLEERIRAYSPDGLNTFYPLTPDASITKHHKPTTDCVTWCDYYVSGPVRQYYADELYTYRSAIKANWESYTQHPLFTKEVFNKLNQLALNETIIYKQGIYYRVKINTVSGPSNVSYETAAVGAPFNSIIANVVTKQQAYCRDVAHLSSSYYMHNTNGGKVFIYYNELVAAFYLEEITNMEDIPGITVNMSTTRNAVLDQPYDIFAIPATNTILKNGNDLYEVVGEYAQKSAMALVKELTSANVYDVQLLPYCPMPELAVDNKIDISNLRANYDYDYITQTGATVKSMKEDYCEPNEWEYQQYEATIEAETGLAQGDIAEKGYEVLEGADLLIGSPVFWGTTADNVYTIKWACNVANFQDAEHIKVRLWWQYNSTDPVVKSIIIYPKKNSFSVSLDYNLALSDSMKIDSQCDLYRLCSPNYQGSFDFNVAKNGGSVKGFIADCSYKPYTPYIKVAPNFDWLYGANFGDCRGLICGGDFSIGIIDTAWQNYQLQNKNYQNIFNREIQNLDFNQNLQRQQQYAIGGIGIVSDTIKGAGTGAMVGGGWGALAGAALGATSSGIGYAIDNDLMEGSLAEQRQFSIDKFRMQLGNVQSLPYTLTKVGSFDINSKIWPFLEYYTCSDEEKEALRMKIQYEGMTVGIIDLLGNYMGGENYVQADLVRNTEIVEDSHILDDIYIELTKGVYV